MYAATIRFLLASAIAALVLAACGGGSSNGSSGGLHGLDRRVQPTGLHIPTGEAGSPVRPVDAFPNLRIRDATFITHAGDGSNRLFVSDRAGVIRVFGNDRNATEAPVFLDLSSRVDTSAYETGLLGLVFDRGFSSNGYFYVTYVTPPDAAGAGRKLRLSRFQAAGNSADATSEKLVLEFDHTNDYHFGGWIGWGPDGMLYMSSGDGGNDVQAQDPTANIFGKILRISIDSTAGTYAVPTDNPFAGSLTWAYGLRNPWRCSFDRANGQLWCGDVGETSREEINLVKKGLNYGWPYFEGDQPYRAPGTRSYGEFEPPVFQYGHAIGAAVIGGYVYRGSAVPALEGRYLYSDYVAPYLWALKVDDDGALTGTEAVAEGTLPDVSSFGEDEAGEVYAVTAITGVIYRFEPGAASASEAMPATLSATGLFTDVQALTPAPFLIDYSVNAPFWSDGATKRRWFVVPGEQRIDLSSDGVWSFPVGTITVKHFELPLASGATTRLETRVMVHRIDGWVGYTYVWRDDQGDADLLTRGATAFYDTIDPVTSQPVRLAWTFPGQAQCMRCHTQAAGRVLGLTTPQLNRDHTYAATRRSDNQLSTLEHIGVLDSPAASTLQGSTLQYSAMPDPRSGGASVEARAKAWLDTNCSMCHRPNGPTPVDMDLRFATPLADMRLVGRNHQGSVTGVRVVAGDHGSSLLWQRAGATDNNVRMPPLGVHMVDAEGLQLLADWIDSLR